MSDCSYSPYNHRDPISGYANPRTAKKFAEFVVEDILTRHPESKDQPIILIGMDNSSTFLSAFVLNLMPHWLFVSGNKYEDTLRVTDTLEIDLVVFIDDYFCRGDVTRKVLDCLYASCIRGFKEISFYWIEVAYTYSDDKLKKFAYLSCIDSNVEIYGKAMQKSQW